ncbi:MAG: DeoR/GlpR transcriptional regulator [Acidobacteriota bacterium]|nr:DeoR/GlpR transcriptional regulator [Acidobacteriota bacterium]
MSANELRRKEMLALLSNHGSLTIAGMAQRFSVSEMTIRRDIHHLAQSGQILRTPGGATLNRVITFERDFTERLQKMAEAKDKIGRAAASLIRSGESVVLDSGTTTLNIARRLRDRRDITVITFSLAVLDDLYAARVELTGGCHRRSSLDMVGRQVSDRLRKVHANKVFFGAAALSFRKGVMLNDAEAPSEMLEAGTERFLVADSSKIGAEALYFYCRIEDCDQVITDSGIRPEDLRRLRKLTNVIVAE